VGNSGCVQSNAIDIPPPPFALPSDVVLMLVFGEDTFDLDVVPWENRGARTVTARINRSGPRFNIGRITDGGELNGILPVPRAEDLGSPEDAFGREGLTVSNPAVRMGRFTSLQTDDGEWFLSRENITGSADAGIMGIVEYLFVTHAVTVTLPAVPRRGLPAAVLHLQSGWNALYDGKTWNTPTDDSTASPLSTVIPDGMFWIAAKMDA